MQALVSRNSRRAQKRHDAQRCRREWLAWIGCVVRELDLTSFHDNWTDRGHERDAVERRGAGQVARRHSSRVGLPAHSSGREGPGEKLLFLGHSPRVHRGLQMIHVGMTSMSPVPCASSSVRLIGVFFLSSPEIMSLSEPSQVEVLHPAHVASTKYQLFTG